MTSEAVLSVKLATLHEDVGEIKMALGRLSDAIMKLALVEQSQTQLAEALERAFKALGKVEDRVTKLEQAAPISSATTRWVDRGIAGIVGLAAAIIMNQIGVL